MRLLIPLSILFASLIVSCNMKQSMTPVEYNDMIVNEQNKIIKSVFEYVDAVSTGSDKSEKIRLKLVDQCQESLKIVQAMEDYDGNVRLRDTAIDLFKFYLKLSEESFSEISEINEKGEEMTMEDLERLEVLESDMDKKEVHLDNALSAAQEDFAKKHNIQLGENEYQKEVDELNKELE